MNGLLFLAALALAALGLLFVLRVRGRVLALAAAALAFGCAGYALQGRPGLDGSPTRASVRTPPVPPTAARKAMMGQFTAADTWMTISESYARRGNSKDAVGILRSAIRARPNDYALWVGLGNALVDHARAISPAARFAFARADELAPAHPAPRFFLGLALARSGEPEQALALWRDVLAEAPAEVSWRPLVEREVRALKREAPPR